LKIVALVPARADSKRVPDKNIKPLLDKPLIGYAVEMAINCKLVETVYVNSDSHRYLQIGGQFGAKTYLRPPHLATDNSSMKEVVEDFVIFLASHGESYGAVLLLCPVYPIRTSTHLENIIESFFKEGNQRPLIGLKIPQSHPYLCYKRKEDGYINTVMDINENKFYRHQLYPEYYEITLWACIVSIQDIKHLNARMICSDSYGYVIPDHIPFVNIDTPLDFEFAEFLMQKIHAGKIKIE
jgi:CMP-N-acetylneuraminic acid synthetase